MLEADFVWRGVHVGVAQQPRAPEPFPQEGDEHGFARLAWFSPDGGSTVRHFEADRRLVEVFNGERDPGLPRERFPPALTAGHVPERC